MRDRYYSSSSIRYHVIIIGSGIGGLTAGVYLAKAGLRVLLIERREKVGGYCGSFERDGYRFDEAVHYINHMGPRGILRKICAELGVGRSLQILSIDPSDRLLMPGLQIAIYRDINRTLSELSKVFPKEAGAIQSFFSLVSDEKFVSLYAKYKNRTFQDLLNSFFRDGRLKTAISLFGTTMGLTADKLSALAGIAYFKGSILDGGYHSVGGAQSFADALYKEFLRLGGEAILGREVARIAVTSGRARGVELDNGKPVVADVVIANCDATQVFERLLSKEHVGRTFLTLIKKLKPSTSTFVVYLGVATSLKDKIPNCCNLWYFPYRTMRSASVNIVDDDRKKGFVHIGLTSLHDRSMAPKHCESLVLFTGAEYRTEKYWRKNKERLADILVERACQAIPEIRGRIQVRIPASPHTLFRYTLNRGGAYRGWEATPNQTKLGLVPQKTHIYGLFLAGHWITTPVGNGGVSMVAQSGRLAARAALHLINVRSPAHGSRPTLPVNTSRHQIPEQHGS